MIDDAKLLGWLWVAFVAACGAVLFFILRIIKQLDDLEGTMRQLEKDFGGYQTYVANHYPTRDDVEKKFDLIRQDLREIKQMINTGR